MKKSILFTAILLSASTFLGCRNNESGNEVEEIDPIGTDETGKDEIVYGDQFSEFDLNADDRWDENEFRESFETDFTAWDEDGDGLLGEEEFYVTTFSKVDRDNNDQLDQEEWKLGYNNIFGAYLDETDYNTFDTNGDGSISQEEWHEGLGDSEWFDTYDADSDGRITPDEWRDGTFQDWDRDDDNFLDVDEYNNAYNGVW